MKAYYMTGPMRQYEQWAENLMKTKPKHPRPYGIKRPDFRNVLAVVAAVVFILVVATQLFD